MHNMSNLTLDLEARSETKIDLSLGEDLFFVFLFCFGLHLFSGSKTVPILGDDLFLFDLHLQNSPPPHCKFLATRLTDRLLAARPQRKYACNAFPQDVTTHCPTKNNGTSSQHLIECCKNPMLYQLSYGYN